jgi:hypothetical protein
LFIPSVSSYPFVLCLIFIINSSVVPKGYRPTIPQHPEG